MWHTIFFVSLGVAVFVCAGAIALVVWGILQITIQGKMTGGLTRAQAWREIGRELIGRSSPDANAKRPRQRAR
jgi:K+-transporting ATPase c subunit